MTLIAELKRRKVFKVGVACLVVAWLAVQAASIGFPTFDAPVWVLRVFILVVLAGFPVALVLAWAFDFGLERSARAATHGAVPCEHRGISQGRVMQAIGNIHRARCIIERDLVRP